MDSSLPENVTVLTHQQQTFYVLGTAHISEQSVADVNALVDKVRPDAVAIELCATRYEALIDKARWKKLDIFKVIREGKTLLLMANLAIAAYQRRLGQQLGIEPGAEMIAATKKAQAAGVPIELIDRDIQVTLKRTWACLSFWKKLMLSGVVLESTVTRQKITVEDIEKLKEKAQLSQLMDEFAQALPEVKTTLIDERDQYMIAKLRQSAAKSLVAVVGAGHVEGMKRHLDQPVDLHALEKIPPTAWWVSSLKWILPAIIIGAFAWGYWGHQGETFQDMLTAWIIPTALLGGLFTALAAAKPLSVITAIVVSPITTLHPLLGAGMIVGLVEAWLRKPTVEDAEKVNDAIRTISGVYRNPFTRVLLVTVLSSLGAALGALTGVVEVLSLVL